MGRERSRSRSPPRGFKRARSGSGSPRPERRGFSDPDPETAAAAAQALAAAEVQRILAQQPAAPGISGLPAITLPGATPLPADAFVALPGPPLPGPPAAAPASTALVTASSTGAGGLTSAQQAAIRKAKEVYIGNLAIGQTTAEVLRDLFNAALAGFVREPATAAVNEVKMDPVAGRFAFVELTSEELATRALTLDRTEVFGKQMKIARPSGYIGPQEKSVAVDKLALAQQLAAKLATGTTNVILMEGLVPAEAVRDEEERREITEMVYEEALRCGKVRGVVVPLPPHDAPPDTPCRVYVKYDSSGEASKLKEMMDGRVFDDHKITADFVTEVEYTRSSLGEWFTGNVSDGPPALLAAAASGPVGGGGGGGGLPVGGSLTGLPTIKL